MPICISCNKLRCLDLMIGTDDIGYACFKCIFEENQKEIEKLKAAIRRILRHNF